MMEVKMKAKCPPSYSNVEQWIFKEAIEFSLDERSSLAFAVKRMMASFDDSLELLGLGEALHGGKELLIFRNRLFENLVEEHGFSAIAIESSFPRARIVNDFVTSRAQVSCEELREQGFSHGFGHLEANRELVEWMRRYNDDPCHPLKLRFYAFDSPTEMMRSENPREILHFVLDYFSSLDSKRSREYAQCIDSLLGDDSAWENPEAMLNAEKSGGDSDEAKELRIQTEELISELEIRSPEFVVKSGKSLYLEALHYAFLARELLNYHAALARKSAERVARVLGIREMMMARNLEYIVSCGRWRGKVLAYAHNSHLQRGEAQ